MKNLIGRVRKNKRAGRALALTLEKLPYFSERREITRFAVLIAT